MSCPDTVGRKIHWSHCAKANVDLTTSLVWNGADTDCKRTAESYGVISCDYSDWWPAIKITRISNQKKKKPPNCVISVRFQTWANDRPQSDSMQTNGRSPVCRRRWLFKLVICVKALPQSEHTYGRTFVCIRSWFRKLAACVNPVKVNAMRFWIYL